MFKLDWLRGQALATNTSPMGTFDSGVVCPDGTVMWVSNDEESFNMGVEANAQSQTSSSNVQQAEQVHYHYHRFGMGPWLFLGLQVSLAIALLLILSPSPEPPAPEAPLDLSTIPKPDYLIGFLY